MASLVDRKDSQFWWIKFIDPTTGKRVFESTLLRKKDSLETKKARALEASWTSKEKNTTAVVASSNHAWAEWVPSFLKRHCKGRTYERYVLAWNWLFSYLREIGVNRPNELTFKHCLGYLEWRTTKDTRLNSRRKKTKVISLNTALHEIKVLRLVMNQAIKLGIVQVNPCLRLGVGKAEIKQKPELTDDDITTVRKELLTRPEWMRTCFEIALHTGCRQRETRIKLAHIDFKNDTILFDSPKGGRDRTFTTPLPAAIKPTLLKINQRGDSYTLTFPRLPSKDWWQFFKAIGRSDLCFHSTRVWSSSSQCIRRR
jgi:hypothetical protein